MTTTEKKATSNRTVAHIKPGKKLPNLINPPVAPPPSKAEVVKAMVELHRERCYAKQEEAMQAASKAEAALKNYVDRMGDRRELMKPDPDMFAKLAPGRRLIRYKLESDDSLEENKPRETYRHCGHCRWEIIYSCDDKYDNTVCFPYFAPPEPIASEWKALRASVIRAREDKKKADADLEPSAIAAVRRKIQERADTPQRRRCEALLADEESRKVLGKALDAALREADASGRPLVDAVPA